MKYRIFILGLIATLFVACAVNEVDHSAPLLDDSEEFYATIEGATTKVFVDEELKVLWHADDRVSIFNKYTYNQQYRFTGKTGANSGSFKKVPNEDFVTGNALDYVYAVYPYQEATEISNKGVLSINLPATQAYAEDSFGIGANTMVSCSEGNELLFKNLCGYIILKLYGDDVTVSSISLKGNNNEPLAGKATVNASIDGDPSLSFDFSATKEITLTFPTPVTLGTTAETATPFWLVVPPTTFGRGITLTVKDIKNGVFEKASTKSLEISRNTLSRMSELEVIPQYPEPSDDAIVFADIVAKYACVEKFDTNHDGEVSYKEAAAASSLSGLFSDWNTVTSFDEIQYFTGVTSISGVFTGLTKLTHITVPEWITTLGYATFQNCSALETVVLPAALSSLSSYCFDGCSSLTDITLPNGITSIPQYCFQNCTALTTLTVPSTVTLIGAYAFSSCVQLAGLDLPSNLKTIGNYAFQNCQAISSLDCPGSITTLGKYAFSGCTSLSSVSLPENLSSIPAYCFQNCTALNVTSWPQALISIGDGAFADCRFKNADYAIELPSTVTSIGDYAFDTLHHIIIPSASPVSIASHSFATDYTFLYVPAAMVEMYKVRTNWSNYEKQIRPISDYPVELSLGGATGEAIDLGLSVKWASWNVGASAPEEYGAYFSWGETDIKWDYDWASYKLCMGSNDTLTKYCTSSSYGYNGFTDGKTVLDPEDDAAHVQWGGSWRMPTDTEWTELRDNCTWEWTKLNGVNGRKVTSNKAGYTEKWIFLPAAGDLYDAYLRSAGSLGYYLSSSLSTVNPRLAWDVYFESDGVYRGSGGRCYGQSVRPVYEE